METAKVSGIYAICGPNGVYVGESADCWHRSTLALAVALGLDCGIIRELPDSTLTQRRTVEAEVVALLQARGLVIVSRHAPWDIGDWPGRGLRGAYKGSLKG